MMYSILIVEDDQNIALGLNYALSHEQFNCVVVHTFADAMNALNNEFDFYILDLGLPDGSGIDLCQYINKTSQKPILMLSAYDQEHNIVMALDNGADDYMIKPFRIKELISRIHSILRRYQHNVIKTHFQIANLRIDINHSTVYKDGNVLFLSNIDYRLLLLFVQNPNAILTRNRIIDVIWGIEAQFIDDNTLSAAIKRLREKIEDNPKKPVIILTVRGIGYRLGHDEN